jgi:hypothetical protein
MCESSTHSIFLSRSITGFTKVELTVLAMDDVGVREAGLPARPMAIPVKDELVDIRTRIRSKSCILQKLLIFEASIRPHIHYLEKDIREFGAACDEHRTHIREMLNEIRDMSDAEPKGITERQRHAKLARIRKLEATYENLLKEKAFYLARAAQRLEGMT